MLYNSLGSWFRHINDGNFSFELFLPEELDDTNSYEAESYILWSLPYPSSQGDSLDPREISEHQKETCHLYKCRGNTDNIHVADFLARVTLYHVFVASVLPPAQWIPNI